MMMSIIVYCLPIHETRFLKSVLNVEYFVNFIHGFPIYSMDFYSIEFYECLFRRSIFVNLFMNAIDAINNSTYNVSTCWEK